MEAFQTVITAFAAIPAWVPLLLYPAALILFTVLVLLFGGRGAYAHVAIALGGAAFTLIVCKGELGAAFVFLGLYAALASLLRLLFLLPPVKRKKGGKRKRLSRDERMYQKFHAEPAVSLSPAPPKVCMYEEEEPRLSAAESGMQLKYAEELLSRLKKSQLAPADRLEIEALSHTLGAYRTKPLTEGEKGVLGDCLASILKMTAKYKL